MLNTMQDWSMLGARLKAALATLLLAGSGLAMAANVTVDLCATTGTATLPPDSSPASVPVFGYAVGACTPTTTVTTPGGPVIVAAVGDTVTVNLSNKLPRATGLLFQGQALVPDTTGAAAGTVSSFGTKTYTFTPTAPGTYLYEAALLPNSQHQVAMGLYGALVIRPPDTPPRTDAGVLLGSGSAVVQDALIQATDLGSSVTGTDVPAGATIVAVTAGASFTMSAPATGAGDGSVTLTRQQAYADNATSFNDEAVLVLSEIDTALANAADPAAFDMRTFAPRYFLINGKAYPHTDPIASAAGHRVLLRYVNAGVKHHSMGVLGLRQVFVAKGGSTLPTLNHNVAAETLAPGQTGDAIATIPAAATTASRFAVYDASLSLRNSNAPGFGGMLTFVTAGAGSASTGPSTGAVSLSPNPSNGSGTVNVSASVSSAASTIAAAEYFIDSVGANGSGLPMAGSFGAASASVSATISLAQLAALPSGKHSLYVRGQDATGAWGGLSSSTLNLGKSGPLTSGLSLTPNPSSGSVNVALHGTGDSRSVGGFNITQAEYFIGTPGANGSGTPMTLNLVSNVVSLDTSIAPPVSAGVVSVHSRDELGNWGPFATINLNVAIAGPTASGLVVNKNPNNGSLALNASQPVVRLSATMSSAGSTIAAAEGFIDAVGANGTGFPFTVADGVWNGATEAVFVDIPLATIKALAEGTHTLYVRGKDAVGNWGSSGATVATWPATALTTLVIDKTAPSFTGLTIAPSPTLGAATVALNVLGAADPTSAGVSSGVVGGEYWLNPPTATDPAPGNGTPFSGSSASIPVSALANGNYTVRARIRDAAGNWSTGTSGVRQASLVVAPDAIFANDFETGVRPWGWSAASTNTAARLNVSATAALAGTLGLQAQGNNTNYVQYNFPATQPATATYDARFYFRPNGNSSTGKDILSAATSNNFGTTLFRVRYRLSAGVPQVQIQVGGTANATWTNILGGTSNNQIEVVWQSGTSLQLYVNGVLSQTLPTANTGSVAAVRLGSATATGSAALMYFDAFASKRTATPLIGP